MNSAVYTAAIREGCTRREAEVLATLVESRKAADAARKLGIAESTVKNHLVAVRRRFDAPHTLAVVARLLSAGGLKLS